MTSRVGSSARASKASASKPPIVGPTSPPIIPPIGPPSKPPSAPKAIEPSVVPVVIPREAAPICPTVPARLPGIPDRPKFKAALTGAFKPRASPVLVAASNPIWPKPDIAASIACLSVKLCPLLEEPASLPLLEEVVPPPKPSRPSPPVNSLPRVVPLLAFSLSEEDC